MSTTAFAVFPEIAELDSIVEAARAKVARARGLIARRDEAQAVLASATIKLTSEPSQPAADEYAAAWSRHQAAGAVAQAIDEAGATDEKLVIQSALSSEKAFELLGSAWSKRLAAVEGLIAALRRRFADARHAATMAGITNPMLVELSPAVVAIRDLLNIAENHAQEARVAAAYCEAEGRGHEPQDLVSMLGLVRRPLPEAL